MSPRRAPRAARRPRLRALVTDIDGTLTDGERRLDPTAFELIRRLSERGVLVIIATGNVLPIALGIYRALGLNGPIVAENGGLLYRKVGGHDRVEKMADRSLALRAFRRIRGRLGVKRLFTDRWRETEVALEPTVTAEEVQRLLGDNGDVIAEGTGFAVHLMQRGVGKLSTLSRALQPYGFTPSDCLVLGDGDNDVPMLSAAGWGVSFPNGSPGARSAADLVTRRPYAFGFVEGIKRSPAVVPMEFEGSRSRAGR